jgi:hypothetical protein
MDAFVAKLKTDRDYSWHRTTHHTQAIQEPCIVCRSPIGFGEDWRVYPNSNRLVHRSCDEQEARTYGPWVPEYK